MRSRGTPRGFRDVDVYESAASVKELGVGINVLPHATRELTELGLPEELCALAIPTANNRPSLSVGPRAPSLSERPAWT